MHATYGPGSRSRSLSEGRSSTAAATLSGRRSDVYFDANASPTHTPAADHQPSDARDRGGDWSARTTAYTATDSNASSGASGVASTRPAAASGMNAKVRAVTSAALAPAMRRAVAEAASVATAPAISGKNRMTSGAGETLNSAASAVPARISTAIIGG